MGHDHTADVKAVKRFAAFASNTWYHNSHSLSQSRTTTAPLTPGTTILKLDLLPHKHDHDHDEDDDDDEESDDESDDDDDDSSKSKSKSESLKALTLQVDDWVGAVTHVREGTLLAALKRKEEFKGETDEVAGKIKGVEFSRGAGAGTTTMKGKSDDEGVVVVEKNHTEMEGDGKKGKRKEEDEEDEEEGRDEDDGDGGADAGEEEEEERYSKMQILMWRSESVGASMAEQLGPQFRIPTGFY